MVPTDCKYTKEHEWVRIEGDVAVVGITDYAQKALGDITYIELPVDGRQVKQSEEFVVIESVKAAADIYAPVSGRVAEANQALVESPEIVNEDPHQGGWICKLVDFDRAELENLLSPEQYEALLKELG